MDDPKVFEALAQSLEKDYVPLDPALVRALLADFDTNDQAQLNTLRELLDALRADAVADDGADFDPSGMSGAVKVGEKSTEEGWERGTGTEDTEFTNLSHNLSSVGISHASSSDADGNGYMGNFEEMDGAGKAKHLGELFPTQSVPTIEFTLKKCDGSFARAMDVLLNLVYFEEGLVADGEERVRAKGVDAFDEAINPRGRKKKGKRKNGRSLHEEERSASEDPVPTPTTAQNHWQLASGDIEFISSRTNLPLKMVQTLYNKHGASRKATISAILEQEIEKHDEPIPDDPVLAVNVATLASEFPSLPLHYAAALIRITDPSTAKAHELAKALTASSGSRTPEATQPPAKIIPQYAPIRLDSDTDTSSSPMVRSSSSPSTGSSSATPLSSAVLASLRSNAFNSASTYHRKAGSDRLFGGAAAYYGQVGRDYNAQLRAATAAEADAHVASQSTADKLDLHGVSVADAVRITEEKVKAWWEDVRVREGRSRGERVAGGLTVVTGRGAHSKEGKGRIGPAVVRMLVGGGWKVEVGSGLVVVTGKVKK
ncbi:hypothetical protein NA57DRAFT_57363 [Rhizodiscina lignyota]|uniref:Smr domain-containing protein n=1 Tax=Rhizodiscina lignyota TaxID=1504668 RepID=A0A9P4IF58_9PEZI|nr:hypothetical protein NA57DRAFT_57363 [Rhizodiscina lignyota]